MSEFNRLLSVSLLHRHGARGPGESELKPFNPDAPTKCQWKKEEEEEITSIGAMQMKELGKHFASKYLPYFSGGQLNEKTFWRSSKSGRAKDSGLELVKGINEIAGSPIISDAVKYDIDADNYFRPWKIYKPAVEAFKAAAEKDPIWIAKANENYELLCRVFKVLGLQDKIISKPVKSLWSATYISCLIAVEAYWPEDAEKRSALKEQVASLDSSDIMQIHSLSLWVWQQRFIDCYEYPLLGGNLSSEILERAINPQYQMNVYSGHDYTVLSVLSNLRVYPQYLKMMQYACTITVEVWEGSPPVHSSGPAKIPYSGPELTLGMKTVRVLLNPCPYCEDDSGPVMITSLLPSDKNEIVLADFSESQIMEKISEIRNSFKTLAATAQVAPPKDDEDGE